MPRVFRSALFLPFLLLVAASSGSSVLAQRPPGPRITLPIDDRVRVTLKGNVHPLAQSRYDQGAAPDELPMERMLLVLERGPTQEASLRQLLDDQQVKSSPRYHQWLTPEQFGRQFGPADEDIQALTGWLTGQGFRVTNVAAGRTVIEFSGTAGLVRQVLGTEIHRFRVSGKDHWANASDPQIPAALAPVVAGFASLNNFPRRPLVKDLGVFSRSRLTGEVKPLFTYPPCQGNDCTYNYALGPIDFATIYNVRPLWAKGTDGKGETIAVVGETNINPQDVADFRSMFDLQANAPNIILNGPDPGINDEETEADLDVEWSGAIAKGATIDLVVSETTEATPGVDLSALYIIDNDLAPVMSISYGTCEAELGAGGNAFHSALWEQAAAQGITVVVAAGDSGSAACDSASLGETAAQYGLAVSGLASTPFNVAVGGTDFNDTSSFSTYWNTTNSSPFQNSALSYIPEMTWDDGCASTGTLTACTPPEDYYSIFSLGYDLTAGGGGPSSCINPSGVFPNVTCSGNYAKPSWQSGTGVPSDGARDVPDVSLFAGNGFNGSFYIICQMDANSPYSGSATSCDLNSPYTDFQGVGGTSASAQVFAGIMALVNQAHGRQGNANYVFYPLAAQGGNTCVSNAAAVSNASCIFYDITTGSNSVICQGGSPNCNNTNNASGQYGIMVSGNPASAAYTAGSGYDLATGLGSVNVANLVKNWTSNFAPTTTTLALSTNPATNPIALAHGQPIDFTINVTSGSGTPAGDVSLIAQTGSSPSNATGIGPFTLSGGSVSSSTVMLPGGSYNVTAHYAGNGTYAASDSTPGIPVTVNKESSQTEVRLVSFSATAPVYNVTTVPYGTPYALRMDVTNGSGQLCASPTTGLIAYPCPSGALKVTPAPTEQNPPSGAVAGSYSLNSQGYAEDQAIQQTPGTYNFVATYAGDNSYTGSTSPSVPITITQAPTTTTITSSSSNLGSPFPVYVSINTQSDGAGPTGTVDLLSNGVSLGKATVSGSPPVPGEQAYEYATGSAGANLTLPPGSTNLIAQYSGDGNYTGSTSAQVTLTVTDFSVSANPSQVTISAPGQTGSSTLSVTPQNGFNGTVSFSVASGCPTGATCTFSPAYVNMAGASAVTSTLTITTTGASNAAAILLPPLPNLASRVSAESGSAALPCGKPAAFRRNPDPSFAAAQSGRLSLPDCVEEHVRNGRASERRSLSANQAAEPQSRLPWLLAAIIRRAHPGIESAEPQSRLLWLLAGPLLVAILLGSSGLRRRPAALWFATTLLVIGAVVACGGGGGGGSAPPPPPAPAVSLAPSSLAFGSVNVGASSPLTVTLTNTGNATLNIASMSLSGTNAADFSGSSTCPSSVSAQGSCTISVTFTPTATGARSASVSIADNAGSSPQTISLSGTGVQPGTPAGTYPVVVNAVSGTDTHAVTVNVVVQ